MFSFGANIDPSKLRSRGVSPSASLLARAPGYRLNFIHRGGYATIDEMRDEDVPADESAPASDQPPVPHPRTARGARSIASAEASSRSFDDGRWATRPARWT